MHITGCTILLNVKNMALLWIGGLKPLEKATVKGRCPQTTSLKNSSVEVARGEG